MEKKDTFPKDWRDAEYGQEFLSIGRAIVKGDMGGCGVFKVKQSLSNNTHYLLACTNMNEPITWKYYSVNSELETIEPYLGNANEPDLD